MLGVSENRTENYTKALDILVNMAKQKAFLETINCLDSDGKYAHCDMRKKEKMARILLRSRTTV